MTKVSGKWLKNEWQVLIHSSLFFLFSFSLLKRLLTLPVSFMLHWWNEFPGRKTLSASRLGVLTDGIKKQISFLFFFFSQLEKRTQSRTTAPKDERGSLGQVFFPEANSSNLIVWVGQKTKEPSQMVCTYDEIREFCEPTVVIFSQVGQDGSSAVDQSENTRIAITQGEVCLL